MSIASPPRYLHYRLVTKDRFWTPKQPTRIKCQRNSVHPAMTAHFPPLLMVKMLRRQRRPRILNLPLLRRVQSTYPPLISACPTARPRQEGNPCLLISRFSRLIASSFKLLTSSKVGRIISSEYLRMFMEICGCSSVSHSTSHRPLTKAGI